MAERTQSGPIGWLRRQIPTRETVHDNWLLRPFAHHLSHPALWRLHHRSVPRAVALGLGVGVIIPFAHMIVAALIAIPLRANVAIAAACTLVVNPLTIPALYYAAYRTGLWELRHDSVVMPPGATAQISGELSRMLFWVHAASGPIALGILTIAAVAATVGYIVSAFGWRLWLSSKWRQRRHARRVTPA